MIKLIKKILIVFLLIFSGAVAAKDSSRQSIGYVISSYTQEYNESIDYYHKLKAEYECPYRPDGYKNFGFEKHDYKQYIVKCETAASTVGNEAAKTYCEFVNNWCLNRVIYTSKIKSIYSFAYSNFQRGLRSFYPQCEKQRRCTKELSGYFSHMNEARQKYQKLLTQKDELLIHVSQFREREEELWLPINQKIVIIDKNKKLANDEAAKKAQKQEQLAQAESKKQSQIELLALELESDKEKVLFDGLVQMYSNYQMIRLMVKAASPEVYSKCNVKGSIDKIKLELKKFEVKTIKYGPNINADLAWEKANNLTLSDPMSELYKHLEGAGESTYRALKSCKESMSTFSLMLKMWNKNLIEANEGEIPKKKIEKDF